MGLDRQIERAQLRAAYRTFCENWSSNERRKPTFNEWLHFHQKQVALLKRKKAEDLAQERQKVASEFADPKTLEWE